MSHFLKPFIRALIVVLSVNGLVSCQLFKASPAEPSRFLVHAKEMTETKHSPFQKNWTNETKVAVETGRKCDSLYIAPVTLKYLRPVTGFAHPAPETDADKQERLADCRVLANYMRDKFAEAFNKSKNPRFKVVEKPGRNTLTLEMALIEVNPNSFVNGVVRTTIAQVALPGVDSVIARPLKGNTAIEGRLKHSKNDLMLYEFADNQESKSALVIAFRDFMTYGQAREAIEDWAREFEELMRTPNDKNVSGASAFKILPW